MSNEFTAIIERDEDWFIAYCPEIPGANGQGSNIEECKQNLTEAIALILEDRRQDALEGIAKKQLIVDSGQLIVILLSKVALRK